MFAQKFEYTAPKSLDEALHLLASGAKPLAGGMSLIPMMKLRLAAPEHLVDLRTLRDLNYIREAAGELHIGATASHYDVESCPLLRQKCPLLAETAAAIGDVQVRNMGTIGGSVAHSDPAADYPAALQALEAKLVLKGAKSERTVSVRLGVTGLSNRAYRAAASEKALEGKSSSPAEISSAAALVAQGIDANSDLHASADYRRHLAVVHAARALKTAISRIA